MACAGTFACLLVSSLVVSLAQLTLRLVLFRRTQCGVSSAGGNIARCDDFPGARWEDSTNCIRVIRRVRAVITGYPLDGAYTPIVRLSG